MAEEGDMWERGVRLVSDLNSILEFDPYMYVAFLLLFSVVDHVCLCLNSRGNSFFAWLAGLLRSGSRDRWFETCLKRSKSALRVELLRSGTSGSYMYVLSLLVYSTR